MIFDAGGLSVTTSEQLGQKKTLEHVEEMANLKRRFDAEIRIDATRLPIVGEVPSPFWLTFTDIEGEYACEVGRAQRAIRQDWDQMQRKRQRLLLHGFDPCDGLLVLHEAFKDQVETLKAEGLARLVKKRALLVAFYDARLDIYNALRRGDVRGAKEVAALFLAQPAIAP